MKIPLFSKLTARPRARKIVRASAARAARGDEDYYEAEPNMKLSHAFMVVLILHIVAVGGIYAFNKIKVQKNTDFVANISGKIAEVAGATTAPVASSAAVVAAVASAPATPVVSSSPRVDDADEPLPDVVSGGGSTAALTAPTRPAVSTSVPTTAAAPVAKPAPVKAKTEAAAPAAPASGTYTVAKGDNPYKIAKKLGVSYQALVDVNAIKDPTKLQIGQVLKVPTRAN
jgi:LysM repeat protein